MQKKIMVVDDSRFIFEDMKHKFEGIDDYSELYMKADKALYHSKENGRNQYTIASKLPD